MKIYCSGIGGIGLSAYAALQHAAGHTVLGSDRTDSPLLQDLREQGIEIFLNQDGTCVPEDADIFVYSEAIPESAPERMFAATHSIEQQSYFKALGVLSTGFDVIAVCGTHGKSSTTSMAAKVLTDLGVDPNVVVGTKVPDLQGRNWRTGLSNTFILEACEYRRSFHHLSPNIIVMTNVDGDHFDAYKNEDDYRAAFVDFLQLLPENGVVITRMTDSLCMQVAEASGIRNIIDCSAYPFAELQVPGVHMQENAQLVLAMADYLQLDQDRVIQSLTEYKGCWRRLESKGAYLIPNTQYLIPVIDDYGHHPHEITANLSALRSAYPHARIVCVFQPHTHDRTIKLYDQFTTSFTDADVVIIPNIYDARSDIEHEHVRVESLVQDIANYSAVECINGQSLEVTEKMLRQDILQEGDLLVCMGAGDITKLAEKMTNL